MVMAVIVGAVMLAAAAYQGHVQENAGKRSLRTQQRAQDAAMIASSRQERRSAEAIARANRRQPDIGAQLAEQMALGLTGNSSTMLTPPADPTLQTPTAGTLLGH